MNAFLCSAASRRRLIVFINIIWLIEACGLVWGQPGRVEQSAPITETETEPAPSKSEPGNAQPSAPAGPPATIDGFRQARFGMSEEQVRQAVRKDFPAAAATLASAVHPSEKTTILSLSVTDLLPHTGKARLSYIFGYRSKKLIQ